MTVLEPTKFAEPVSPYITDEADILHDIRDQLATIVAEVAAIREKIENTESAVGKIIEEVKPTIDELMNSQLFKMLGMKKKG